MTDQTRRLRQLVTGVVGAAFIFGAMGAQGGCGTSTGTTKAGSTTPATTGSDTTGNNSGDSSAADTFTPTPSMYSVRVKTLSKQCFGSAGCNVSVKLLLTMVDPAAENQAAELTVKITGDETGPTIETIDVDDQGNYAPPTEEISTKSNATVIKAKITEAASN